MKNAFGSALVAGITIVSAGTTSPGIPGPEAVSVKVLPRMLADRPASPWVSGNFVELGFARQADGMRAEMLWNRSFEEIPPYTAPQWEWLERKPGDDLTKEPWWHSGYEESEWRLEPPNGGAKLSYSSYWGFRHGARAAVVANGSPRPAALVQDGLFLRRGRTYRFSGWLATGDETARLKSGHPVRVKVGLYPEAEPARPLAEREFVVASGAFERFEADLAVSGDAGRARFALTVEPGGSVRADGFSLAPDDAVGGWRRDVVELLGRVRPPILRFPGGCFASFYDWRDGIGPEIDRRPRPSPYWGGLEMNDVGVLEMADLCREIGAEPFYCLNLMTGTAQDAADLVAYCNAGPEHPLGRLRASHGHPAPLGLRWFELDNEAYRRFGALEYARRCVEFAAAIRAVDPAARFVMIGYWRYNDSLADVLEIAGEAIDAVTDRDTSEAGLRRDLAVIEAYNRAHGRSLVLCNTEWLADTDMKRFAPGLAGAEALTGALQNRQVRWGYALNAAAQILLFQRLGGGFLFANFNNLANTWGQNVIECAKDGAWLSAAGRVFEATSGSGAAWPLAQENRRDVPGVLSQAAWDKDKTRLVVQAINYGATPVDASFDLSALGFRPREARVVALSADSLRARNTLAEPDAVRRADLVRRLDGAAGFAALLPPFSLSVITLGR